jgi:hypothetical protein
MHRKPAIIATLTLLALLAAIFIGYQAPFALAQAPRKPILGKTFIEGMALDEEGEPLYKQNQNLNFSILDSKGETIFEVKPGVYDIYIANYYNPGNHLRPLRLNGVLITGGKTNRLDITMHKGELLEVRGDAVADPGPAYIISERFEAMQKQIDALKQQVAALKQK